MIGIYCALFWAAFFTRPFQIHGSGSLYDPPNRAVMWKYGFSTQKNYNYMQLNCGGVKQPENGTFNCGICGDGPDDPKSHQRGGKYGSGIISRYYPAGIKEIPLKIELLAFEKGFFEFRICPANNDTVTQECLDENLLPIKEGYLAGTPMRFYPKAAGDHRLTIAINPLLTCERCVLQWRYHTANSWGTDPNTNKEGIGLGLQDEFRNCADIRIGGAVPSSVRNNPFFGQSIANKISTTVDTPQSQKEAMKALMTASLSVQPGNADHLAPNLRTIIFDGSSQTSDLSGHSSAWIKQALNEGQGQSQGNNMEPITSNMRISAENSNSFQFGGDSAAGIATIKKLLHPADGRLKLTAGTDIIKVGKGEGQMRKIQSDMKTLSKNTMTNIDGQTGSSFALNNQLDGNGEINSFAFNNQVAGNGDINYGVDATTMDSRGLTGAMHTIAAGILGSSSGGHNLELKLPGHDASESTGTFGGTIGLVGPPPNPMPKDPIAITSSTMVGPSTDNFGAMKAATRSGFSFDGEGASNAAVGANADYIKDAMSTSGASVSTGITEGMASGSTSTGTEYRGSNTRNINLGNNVIYDSVTTQMNAMTGQSKDRTGNGQRIFQLKVNKPMFIAEGMQPSVDISAGASATIGTDISSTSGFIGKSTSSSDQYDVASSGFSSNVGGGTGAKSTSSSDRNDVASSGFSSNVGGGTGAKSTSSSDQYDVASSGFSSNVGGGTGAKSASDQYDVASSGFSSNVGGGTGAKSASTSDQYDVATSGFSSTVGGGTGAKSTLGQSATDINLANEIDALRTDLIQSSLIQGGGNSRRFPQGNANSETYTGDLNTGAGTASGFNSIQTTTSATNFDGMNTGFIERNINAIVNQANKIMKSTGDAGSISIHDAVQGGGLSAKLVTNPNVQHAIMKSYDKVLSSTKQETNPTQSIDKTAQEGGPSANIVNNPKSQYIIKKVLSNTQQETNIIQSGVDIGKDASVISKQDVARGQYTDGSSGALDVQQKGVFFESMFGGGGNFVNLAGQRSVGAMSQSGSDIVETKSGPSSNQLGGSTIDLSQSDTSRLSGSLQSSGTRARVITQNAGSINRSGRLQGGNIRSQNTGSGTLSINQQETRFDQPSNQAFVRVPDRHRIDGRERSRTQTDLVNIESQLSSFNLGNIPQDSLMNSESQRRSNNEFRFNGEARSSGRREMDRNINVQADRTRGENRVTTVGGDRMDSSRQNLRMFDERRRTFRGDSRGGELPSPDRRRGTFRMVIDPRTGAERRVPETVRPFGRRAGDRLISDIRDGGFRRSSTGEGDRRTSGTARSDRGRFEIRTIDRAFTSRSRERFPDETRMESFGRNVAVRTRDRPSSERRGFRDPKYFVDMTGSGTRINGSNVVIDNGISNRGMQGERGPAAMPRDAVAAFDAESAGRRDMSVVTGSSRSDRSGSRDTRLVIEGDLSRSSGGRTSDRDSRRDSRGRSGGVRTSVDTRRRPGSRDSSRDRRRDMGIRHDGLMIGGGGMGMMPMGSMPFGGFPGGGMPGGGMHGGGMPGGGMPGGGMPGGVPFGGHMLGGGMPGPMMGGGPGPFGGGLPGGPFPPMGFGPGMV